MIQIDFCGGNTSLIKQLLCLSSNHCTYDCNERCLIQKQQSKWKFQLFFVLIALSAALFFHSLFFSLKLYNISDSAELGVKEPNWFHYSQRGYDRPRKCHFRNPAGAPCSAATHPAHLMESVHFWFPYQWSWNVRGVIWTSPPDTADLIKEPGHISECPGEKKKQWWWRCLVSVRTECSSVTWQL